MKLLLPLVLGVSLAAQSYPPAFPRPNATPLLETARFVVWDIVWPNGQPTPMHRHLFDQVGTYYAAGGRIITAEDGTKRSATTPVGALSRTRRGTTHIEEGSTDPPLRAVFIELKHDAPSGQPEPASGAPAAFPREGASQLLDDERVSVWDHTWKADSARRQSRYPRETVVIWLEKGTLRLTPEDGAAAVVSVAPGQIRHYARGTLETEELLDGTPRAMIISFK